ncbi:DUF3237 domain-containing protein [Rhizomicrobium electricum]|jgi:hypothetical protein|nr:DUF3237 domain-containing protein [Rhizomicrobium electricum]NIJ49710.1 hypothetical protein [Rhizomicrobium electricum]
MRKMNRRTVMAGAVAAGAAGVMARAAEPETPGIAFAFEAYVTIGAAETPGPTPFGGRNRIPITGGHFEGPAIKGKVLPGGADWQLVRSDGAVTLEADYMIQADDGTLIHVHNHAVVSGKPGTPDYYLRCAPVFEAPIGKHDWLNKALFVGTVTVEPKGDAVRVRVYKVT